MEQKRQVAAKKVPLRTKGFGTYFLDIGYLDIKPIVH